MHSALRIASSTASAQASNSGVMCWFGSIRVGTGAPATVAALPGSSASTTGLAANGYYFVLRTVDAGNNLSPTSSNEILLWTGSPPSAPTNLQVLQSDQALVILWDTATAGAYPIAGYRIYRYEQPAGPWELVGEVPVSQETWYLDSGLSNALSYDYYVVAFDEKGKVENHLGEGVTTVAPVSPNAAAVVPPHHLSAQLVNDASDYSGDVVLNWIPAPHSGEVVGYYVVRVTNSGTPVTIATLTDDQTSTYTDLHVPDESTHEYYLYSYTATFATSPRCNLVEITVGREILVTKHEMYFDKNTFLPLEGQELCIEFGLAGEQPEGQVTLRIYNIAMEQMLAYENVTVRPGDIETRCWDGRDEDGDLMASGVYLVNIQSADGSYNETKKVVLVK